MLPPLASGTCAARCPSSHRWACSWIFDVVCIIDTSSVCPLSVSAAYAMCGVTCHSQFLSAALLLATRTWCFAHGALCLWACNICCLPSGPGSLLFACDWYLPSGNIHAVWCLSPCLRPRPCFLRPQEPFLFSGTVRSNLDPFNSYTDVDLWRAVSSVGLKEAINALEDGMDSHVVDGGNNFSQVSHVDPALLWN